MGSLKLIGDNVTTTTARKARPHVLSSTCGELSSCDKPTSVTSTTSMSPSTAFVGDEMERVYHVNKKSRFGQFQIFLSDIKGLKKGESLWVNLGAKTVEAVTIASLFDSGIKVVEKLKFDHDVGEQVISRDKEAAVERQGAFYSAV